MKDRFEDKIKSIYGDRSYDILENLKFRRLETFRVNTLKAPISKTITKLKGSGYSVLEGPFKNTFINNSNISLSNSPEFNDGIIYLQGFSSIYDIVVLDPHESDHILDLCAAPGSKTSLISEMTNNNSVITAVENNSKRYFQMMNNLKNMGVTNVTSILGRASVIPFKNPTLLNYFDKVLADVPCSNEAIIRETDTFDFSKWTYKLAKKLPMLQKKIVAAGINMLKPGGTLVYSTCTYSIEENEDVVKWVLKKFKNMRLVPIDKPLQNMVDGIDLPEVLRILPNSSFDAFFVAKFQKI